MCPTTPSLKQLLFCVGWQRGSEERGGFCLESMSLTPDSFFCQKAKNIRKRTLLCTADVVGGEERGSVLQDTERRRLSVFSGCLQGYTSACESVCVCESEANVFLPYVSGGCLQLVSSSVEIWTGLSWWIRCSIRGQMLCGCEILSITSEIIEASSMVKTCACTSELIRLISR